MDMIKKIYEYLYIGIDLAEFRVLDTIKMNIIIVTLILEGFKATKNNIETFSLE